LRSLKYALLAIGLLLTAIGCGNNEAKIRSAEESMKKYKAVRIVTDAVNAPFEFGSGTGVQGLDVDLGNEIGKALGYEVKWVKASGYDHLFDLLKGGEAEILISAVAIDPQKAEEFAFSKPYYETGDVIAHLRSEFNIKDLSSLSGKKVGVATGRPGEKFMATQKTATGVTVTKYPSLDDALGALNRTEIEAVVGDEPMITYSSYESFKNTTKLPILVNKYQYAAVVRKNETELLAKVNETIERLLASGEIKKSDERLMGKIREEGAKERAGDTADNAARKAPKVINVNLRKLSGAWNMDRLDGFVLVINGAAGQYQSTPILTEGNSGHCKFATPVPPGEYRLNISILKMQTTVPVPELPKTSLTMTMTFGGKNTVEFK
jgi:ABC-type amino acid transport substrate-binding protein